MRDLARFVLGACLAGVLAGGAEAADLASLKQLLASGYEVKAVVFIPPEVLTAQGIDPKSPEVSVTLQRGASIAACQYQAVNFLSFVAVSVEGVVQCDVYPKDANPQ